MARITNYVDGNTLTGAQLNTEIDNIWNNGPSLVSLNVPAVSIVQGLSGSLNSNLGSFQANGYQLKSTSVICSLSATSSYSINTQTAGPIANGRDAAAALASTTVHFYAITTGGTSTNARGICSSNPPPLGPTLPAGYTAWAYLASAIYSTASSAISGTYFVTGNKVTVQQVSAAANLLLSAGGATAETDVACGTLVPLIAPRFTVQVHTYGALSGTVGAAGVSVTHRLYQEAGIVYLAWQTIDLSTNMPSGTEFTGGGTFFADIINLRATPTLGYSHSIVTGTSGHMTIRLQGYSVPNGDAG